MATGQHAPGFLELLLFVNACIHVCVCPPPRLLITSGVMCDIDPYDWLKKFYGFYMAAVVGIGSGCDVSIYTCRGN